MQKQPFGTSDGLPVDLYTLANKSGVVARITNFGGAVVSLDAPDRKLDDVVLGYGTLESYLKDKAYLGAIVGRYANRIARGNFTLDGINYVVAKNNGGNHLHGGVRCFSKRVWAAKDVSNSDEQVLELTYLSKDGEEGYPGNLAVKVIYTLNNNNELKIDYVATTDKDTVINLTNHSYFNLAGQRRGDILNHQLILRGNRFVPRCASFVPTEARLAPIRPFFLRLVSHRKVAALETGEPRKMSPTSFQVNPLRDRPDMVLLLSERARFADNWRDGYAP
jgi:aldose 1-epimerase